MDELLHPPRSVFASCGPDPLGFYPVLDSVDWIQRMLDCGVTTLQLRMKNTDQSDLEKAVYTSIALAKRYSARLFINDYWQLALDFDAYGVHLGQEDIETADCHALQQAGLRLGVSTHSPDEIDAIRDYHPSYIACGAIYHTDTKVMHSKPQGLEQLKAYCAQLATPIVAIGGIKWAHLPAICDTGVDGIAVITAITQANNPEEEAQKWLRYIATHV